MSKNLHVSDWPQECPHCRRLTNAPPAWVRLYDRLSEVKHAKRVRLLRLTDISELLGVSRQRAHQIVKQAVHNKVLVQASVRPLTYRKTPTGCVMYSRWQKAEASSKRSLEVIRKGLAESAAGLVHPMPPVKTT